MYEDVCNRKSLHRFNSSARVAGEEDAVATADHDEGTTAVPEIYLPKTRRHPLLSRPAPSQYRV